MAMNIAEAESEFKLCISTNLQVYMKYIQFILLRVLDLSKPLTINGIVLSVYFSECS